MAGGDLRLGTVAINMLTHNSDMNSKGKQIKDDKLLFIRQKMYLHAYIYNVLLYPARKKALYLQRFREIQSLFMLRTSA